VEPHLPFWFKQRQGKAETAGDSLLRLTAPNMAEAFVGVRKDALGLWHPFLRQTADGPDLTPTDVAFGTSREAWEAAFELHRERFVV
jgi:hypothetical protein